LPPGVIDTGDKYAAGVVETASNLPPVPLTPAANLPPLSLISMAICHRHQQHQVQVAKFATGVVDTGGTKIKGTLGIPSRTLRERENNRKSVPWNKNRRNSRNSF
jgi:hypothetical protein